MIKSRPFEAWEVETVKKRDRLPTSGGIFRDEDSAKAVIFDLIVVILHLTQSKHRCGNATMATLRKAKASLLALIFLVDMVSFSGLVGARPIAMDQLDFVSPYG
jgi:hypothetical protein